MLDTQSSGAVQCLATLARDVCTVNNIQVPGVQADQESTDNQCCSQQGQTNNISLDFTDADLLTSEKNIDLDILNNLSSTPPRTTRPSSLFLTPTTAAAQLLSSPLSSPAKPVQTENKSPMVVPVTMYWNTFPALLLDGVKYVRLIDISRQALPSKETGRLL